MAHHSESYREDNYSYNRHPDEPFSPWRPSVWHLWLAAPIVAAVAVVLTFYAFL